MRQSRTICEAVASLSPKEPPTRSASTIPSLDLVPARHDPLLHRVGECHVVEARGHLIAFLVRPLEEFQRLFCRRLVLWLLIHKHKGRACDRPGVRSGLIG